MSALAIIVGVVLGLALVIALVLISYFCYTKR